MAGAFLGVGFSAGLVSGVLAGVGWAVGVGFGAALVCGFSSALVGRNSPRITLAGVAEGRGAGGLLGGIT